MTSNNLEQVIVGEALIQEQTPEKRSAPNPGTYPGLQGILRDTDHRRLAICSIVCGLSCCGIMSLMYSVKARETRKRFQNEETPAAQKKIEQYTKKACFWATAAILAWVLLIVIFPFLLGLGSFLITFKD
ncbi:hypothetical protein DNTS_035200 [Danionella cerebrum]|uniref:Transmembrane protein 265 n=1 Tax=Danionella cerebrum TaxID=2873325 RepID=A0A553R7U4_9TELE|nr:hypothetical protein DNTS_035200 [Danionella translucida]